jgi:hypothetical protein
MKAIIFTILLSLSLPTLANNGADFKAHMEETSKLRRENAKKIYELRLQGIKEGYEAQLKFFDEMDALAAQMKPGDKENNKKIREQMKSKRKAFKEESKQRRKDFRENKIKPLKSQFKEQRKARKQQYKSQRKANKGNSN